jgi:hypothetical protein
VYNCRSSPELGCLIPYITSETASLLYIALPFEDDLRKFTLENFCSLKKYTPTETQLSLVDDLIESMDLSKKQSLVKSEPDADDDDDESEEPYNPHLVFNPYIQRMYQSIATRAADPNAELPNFDDHITNTYLTRTSDSLRTPEVRGLIKRLADEFPLRADESKKQKKDENIFEKAKQEAEIKTEDNKENEDVTNGAVKMELDDLLNSNSGSKVKKVGTINPVEDFKALAERLLTAANSTTMEEDFEELCLQIQKLTRDLFGESLIHLSENDTATVHSFQEKAFDCVRIQRSYCVKFSAAEFFNTYLKAFKAYLLNECKSNFRNSSHIEGFWREFFVKSNLSLITGLECDSSEATTEAAQEFVSTFLEAKAGKEASDVHNVSNENEEDLLDLM